MYDKEGKINLSRSRDGQRTLLEKNFLINKSK